ncbi:unnamed protein product [Acanthosepion pharaonis]|uniref:Uncharacterized protein n=1 Tax=Acanthosepion pharaonis TaxID=158019 RepID=A0A812AM90_ACAPH|nr:unnamed protein product [Sepia pharaonis]
MSFDIYFHLFLKFIFITRKYYFQVLTDIHFLCSRFFFIRYFFPSHTDILFCYSCILLSSTPGYFFPVLLIISFRYSWTFSYTFGYFFPSHTDILFCYSWILLSSTPGYFFPVLLIISFRIFLSITYRYFILLLLYITFKYSWIFLPRFIDYFFQYSWIFLSRFIDYFFQVLLDISYLQGYLFPAFLKDITSKNIRIRLSKTPGYLFQLPEDNFRYFTIFPSPFYGYFLRIIITGNLSTERIQLCNLSIYLSIYLMLSIYVFHRFLELLFCLSYSLSTLSCLFLSFSLSLYSLLFFLFSFFLTLFFMCYHPLSFHYLFSRRFFSLPDRLSVFLFISSFFFEDLLPCIFFYQSLAPFFKLSLTLFYTFSLSYFTKRYLTFFLSIFLAFLLSFSPTFLSLFFLFASLLS